MIEGLSCKNSDLIVIGGGPGGYLAAELAAKRGLSVYCWRKEQLAVFA